MDPGAIAGVIPWIQRATDAAKALTTSKAKLETAEVKMRLVEMMEALVEARTAALADQETIRQLRAQIKDLQAARAVEEEVILRNGVYYRVAAGQETGPFCASCYVAKKLLMPLKPNDPNFHFAGQYQCPHCKAMM
jgi:hypothetical protein